MWPSGTSSIADFLLTPPNASPTDALQTIAVIDDATSIVVDFAPDGTKGA